ncbi:MAG: peptide deformylase [Candidatus Eisenbacteria bacterium]
MSPRKALPIVQLGDPVLRHVGRELTPAEIKSAEIRGLIERMRDTMRKAPGVGLAAPQVGLGLRLAVIEDQEAYVDEMDDDERAAKERDPVPFHVVINPRIEVVDPAPCRFFEGCLSLAGYVAVVARAHAVRVRCLDHEGEPRVIEAAGWYARILQHEIDHLDGTVYVDRMETRTFMDSEDYSRHWGGEPVELVRAALDAARGLPERPREP